MKVKGSLLNIFNAENSYSDGEFFDEELFIKELSKLHPKNMQKVGEALFDLFLKDGNTQSFSTLKEAFFNLYRIFSYFFEGEGTGLLKSVSYREGLMTVEENLKLPSLIIEGVLKQMMHYFNQRGVLVKNTVEKDSKSSKAVYEISWMRSNVRE